MNDRAINLAFDRLTGELMVAEEMFANAKSGHDVRRAYNAGEIAPTCCECSQPLVVSASKKDRIHFKHLPNAAACLLKDGRLSFEEMQTLEQVYRSRESPRHKLLKYTIARLLKDHPGVDPASIHADDMVLKSGEERRRPDVYCRYLDKELVFEIQLSTLSLRYIQDRHSFYQRKGMYLFWILDNFNLNEQTQMEKDIKYLSHYQNFFKLDERYTDFKLQCSFKLPFISNNQLVKGPWQSETIGLDALQYDTSRFQAYLYDYPQEQTRKEEELTKKRQKEAEEEERTRLPQLIAKFKSKIKAKRANKEDCTSLIFLLDEFTDDDLAALNTDLNFDKVMSDGNTYLNFLLAKYTDQDYHFVSFLIKETRLHLPVNDVSPEFKTTFQYICERIPKEFRTRFLTMLFIRGYIMKPGDETILSQISKHRADNIELWQLYFSYCQRTKDWQILKQADEKISILAILESIKQDRIIGNSGMTLTDLAIFTLRHYRSYWEYVRGALHCYKKWDWVHENDPTEQFAKLKSDHYRVRYDTDYTIDSLITFFFPELE